jgi:hypothetical protein
MKILYILPLIVLSYISFAQETPEIPMKNDLVFYEFNQTLKNEKQCISQYGIATNLGLAPKVMSVMSANKTFNDYVYSFGASALNGKLKLNCTDTMQGMIQIIIPPTKSIISSASAVGLVRDLIKPKIIQHNVTAAVEVLFLSKNKYTLKFKNFQYNVTTMKGGKGITQQIPLGEFYQEFLKTDKKTKFQIEIFNAINYYVNSSNELLLESLTQLYQADEL